MSYTVIIPARMSSTRLPGKPLLDIQGTPMVVRVAQRMLPLGVKTVVAADDQTILEACHVHGVQALLTRNDHASGSDRLAEACALLGLDGPEVLRYQDAAAQQDRDAGQCRGEREQGDGNAAGVLLALRVQDSDQHGDTPVDEDHQGRPREDGLPAAPHVGSLTARAI